MKKIAYLIGAALMIAGMFASCSLDSMSLTEKDTTNFPKTAEDANQALAAIYQNLNNVNAFPQQSFLYNSLLACDDMLGGGGPNDKLMQSLDLICNTGTNATQDYWVARYQGINRANTLLEALAGIEMDPEVRAQAEGEAKSLRAFYYYELASMYGRVPLVITALLPEDTTPPTAAVIWGQILQDLRDAAANMPAVRKSDGHVDKYTAEAMLGRAWLYYTGMYGNGETLNDLVSTNYSPLTSVDLPDGTTLTKQDVVGYIDDCVNNSGYSLVPEFRNLWAYTNKCTVEDFPFTAGQGLKWVEDDAAVNPESMFAIKYNKLASWSTTIGYGNGYALHFGVRGNDQANSFPFGQGWGAGPVAPNFYNDWSVAEQDDARRPASVFKTEDMPSYNKGGGDGFIQETDYYQMKIGSIMAYSTDAAGNKTIEPVFEKIMYGADGWINDNLMQTGSIHDLVLIRFADVLLMQSELKEDVSGINRVRSRAGLEPIGTYSLAALQNERRWELCFEGTRWNDIRRWHIAADALERQTGAKVYTNGAESRNVAQNGGYAARYKATAGFQKIPENQVLLNEGKVEQNEGYTDASAEYNGWQE